MTLTLTPSSILLRDDAWAIFSNVNELLDQRVLGRAGVNEFNQAALLFDLLGRTMTLGARLSF